MFTALQQMSAYSAMLQNPNSLRLFRNTFKLSKEKRSVYQPETAGQLSSLQDVCAICIGNVYFVYDLRDITAPLPVYLTTQLSV
jgi:hypothetical protein